MQKKLRLVRASRKPVSTQCPKAAEYQGTQRPAQRMPPSLGAAGSGKTGVSELHQRLGRAWDRYPGGRRSGSHGAVVPIDNASAFVMGIINLRGAIVAIVDTLIKVGRGCGQLRSRIRARGNADGS